MKIKYIANAVKWFDRANGNTYHSVNVTRCEDGEKIYIEWQYGYGDHYKYTALSAMIKAGWIDEKYEGQVSSFEIDNDYPIVWNVSKGLKRECIANGQK